MSRKPIEVGGMAHTEELSRVREIFESLTDDPDERMVLATILGIFSASGENEFGLGTGSVGCAPYLLDEYLLLEASTGLGWRDDVRRENNNWKRLHNAILRLADKKILEVEPLFYPGTELQRALNGRLQYKVKLNLR